MSEIRKLLLEELTHTCDPDTFGFENTAEIEAVEGMVGQERAVSSIDFGLGIRSEGFSIYVAGRPGTGRNSSVTARISAKAGQQARGSDWVYVHNFRDPYRPRAIRLSSGRAQEFAHDMEEFVKVARAELPRAFESENYAKRRNEAVEAVQGRRDALLAELQQRGAELGFSIEATQVGMASVPLDREGKPYTREEYEALPEEQKQSIKQRGAALQENINQFVSRSRALEKEAQEKLLELDREVAVFKADAGLKAQVTMRLDRQTLEYFRAMAAETGIPYQSLINLYLQDCVRTGKRLRLQWKPDKGAA